MKKYILIVLNKHNKLFNKLIIKKILYSNIINDKNLSFDRKNCEILIKFALLILN